MRRSEAVTPFQYTPNPTPPHPPPVLFIALLQINFDKEENCKDREKGVCGSETVSSGFCLFTVLRSSSYCTHVLCVYSET